MIRVDLIATVSNDFDNNPAIRVISKDNSKLTVAVNFYAKQESNRDTPLFNCSALFFGKTAEVVQENFTPGKTVRLCGNLVQTVSEHNGKQYTNNNIYQASFQFLPQDNSEARDDNSVPRASRTPSTSASPSRRAPSSAAPSRAGGKQLSGPTRPSANAGGGVNIPTPSQRN